MDKNMKKVICGILCLMMVFSMFTVSAATLAINEDDIIVGDADATTGLRTVTIPYTLEVGDDEEAPAYLTMLASSEETVDANNIGSVAIGIEQIANDPAVTSISFVTDKIEEGETYYVKMGATNLATPATATFALASTGGDDEGGDDTEVYTVTFCTDADPDTVYTTKTTNADGKVEAPTAPTKTGFTFAGWATTAGATAADVDLATKVFDANTTLYAVWKEVSGGGDDDDYVLGDANGDGDVDVFDALAILEHDAGITEITGTNLLAADANKDGEVDVFDALLLLEVDAGISEL